MKVEVEYTIRIDGKPAKGAGRMVVGSGDNGAVHRALADLFAADVQTYIGAYRMHLAGHETQEFGVDRPIRREGG